MNEHPKNAIYRAQIVIVGGGIAGLWTLRRLRARGYHAVLVEAEALGAGQTLASQGMIHGGQKHASGGGGSALVESLSRMPRVWADCLSGTGELDLSNVCILADAQYLWAPGTFLGRLQTQAAAWLTREDAHKCSREEWPEVFQKAKRFRGHVLRLDEKVLDVVSLVDCLAAPVAPYIHKARINGIETDGGSVSLLCGEIADERAVEIVADRYLFTAATSNEIAADRLGLGDRATQRRPLRQVFVGPVSEKLYGHCLGFDREDARVTVTSHPLGDGTFVWYLGGGVATADPSRSDAETIARAKKELEELFPDTDWSSKKWGTWYGDRAEPYAGGKRLPDHAVLRPVANAALAWPTKMTLAPDLGQRACDWIEDEGIAPRPGDAWDLPGCPVGGVPWEGMEWT